MSELLQSLIEAVNGNGVFATLLGGGAIVTLFVYARDILTWMGKGLVNLCSFCIHSRFDCTYDSPELLQRLFLMIEQQSIPLWIRDVEISQGEGERYAKRSTLHGTSLHFLFGAFVIIRKEYELKGMRLSTIVNMRVFGRRRKSFMDRLNTELRKVIVRNADDVILVGMECEAIEHRKRRMDTVFMKGDKNLAILEDARKFLASEKIYEQCNIPYKRNYLFYGKPGTGKTSAAIALASELNYNIWVVDIAKSNMDTIVRYMRTKTNTMFVFEDIDAAAMGATRRRNDGEEVSGKDESEVTLSQLLNITDGLLVPNGIVCVFTTNHIEKLDDAFLRDGRMDVKVEFEEMDGQTAAKMLSKMAGVFVAPSKIRGGIVPSSLQESILKYKTGQIGEEELRSKVSEKSDV